MRILIADDEPMMRRVLTRYLESWGHEIVAAEDGAAAWELFDKGDFPIVISDWMMPNMNGLELIRRIRSSARGDYTYAILLTAKSHKEDLVEGMDAGADDFLSKPFDRDELRVRLREGERIIVLERSLGEQNRALLNGSSAPDAREWLGKTIEECVGQINAANAQISQIQQRMPESRTYLQDVVDRLACARRLLSSMVVPEKDKPANV
jgi:two-component system, NtrC family, sensor kinase